MAAPTSGQRRAAPISRQAGNVERVTLTGTHVRLVELTMEHAPALVRAASGDRSTYAFTWVPDGEAEVERYIALALEDRDAGTAVPFVTTRLIDGEIVGSTRFMNIERWRWAKAGLDPAAPPQAVEIGATWLAASAQRTPLNTEAKLLMLTHAFEVWHVVRVTLKTDARNERSRKAILRLGASFDGVLRAHMPAYDGDWPRDSAFYSIVASEWPAVRARLRGALGIPDAGAEAR
jgi:N-acetyltransferase